MIRLAKVMQLDSVFPGIILKGTAVKKNDSVSGNQLADSLLGDTKCLFFCLFSLGVCSL